MRRKTTHGGNESYKQSLTAFDSADPGNVLVIIVNWNGWKDTIECLESLLHSAYSRFSVVVCDNQSTDGSPGRIEAWANGDQLATSSNPALARFVLPPITKPVSVEMISAGERWEGETKLTIIQTGANLGFAGANNIALHYLLENKKFNYAWLLNNDTVVAPDALAKLVERLRESPGAGSCGSKLLFYNAPGVVQAHGGGVFNPVTARSRHVGEFSPADAPVCAEDVQRKMAYVVGASMLVSRAFLEQIGPMDEEYFFYYEEIDWAMRCKGKLRLVYAPESIVYHKQGASIGSTSSSQERLAFSDYYSIRNQLRFTRRYYPQYLPFVWLTVFSRLSKRLLRLQWIRSKAVMQGMWDFIR